MVKMRAVKKYVLRFNSSFSLLPNWTKGNRPIQYQISLLILLVSFIVQNLIQVNLYYYRITIIRSTFYNLLRIFLHKKYLSDLRIWVEYFKAGNFLVIHLNEIGLSLLLVVTSNELISNIKGVEKKPTWWFPSDRSSKKINLSKIEQTGGHQRAFEFLKDCCL